MNNVYAKVQSLLRPLITTPGLCNFYFAKIEDVMYWPNVNVKTGTIDEPILLKDGASWYTCNTIDSDRSYSETQKTDNAGNIFVEISLTGVVPDDNPINALSLQVLPYHRYVILVKERNNMMRLLGSFDSGVTFSRQYISEDSDGRRRNTLSFIWRNPVSPYIYLSAVSDTGIIITPPWEGGGSGGPETDPTVPKHVKSINQQQINNWDTAYGWGNHALYGYLKRSDGDLLYAPIQHTHNQDDDEITFMVGDPNAPVAGNISYTDDRMRSKKVRLIRSGQRKYEIGYPRGDGFIQPNSAGTIYVTPAFDEEEIITIQILK